MKTKRLLLATTAAAAALIGPSLAGMEAFYGTRNRPLEGERYGRLQALARDLEDGARGALEGALADGARDDAADGASSAARALPSIRAFASRAALLRANLDSYGMLPFDVPAGVEDLLVRAREVNEAIRSAETLRGTYADWEAVLGILGRMKVLLAGREVEAPSPHAAKVLSGPQLQEFRRLARDVDASASVAHAKAKQRVGDYPARGRQYLGELAHFAVQSRGLRQLADADEVHPRQVGPVVDRLLEDARQADRAMRDAEVFSSVWTDSSSTITILQRMVLLVQS